MRIYLCIFLVTWTSCTTPVTGDEAEQKDGVTGSGDEDDGIGSDDEGHQVIGSSQTVMAIEGDDVILPCYIEPPLNMEKSTVDWWKDGKGGLYMHRLEDGSMNWGLNPLYKQRASLFDDELSHGNISLKLTRVKRSDEGTYTCDVPGLDRSTKIYLRVGSVSQPVISLTGTKGDLLSWRCDSGCWFPEPQVSWLDSDGNNINAEPSVTEKPSGHCYVVQSTVTVAQTEYVTCRVHLPYINHTAVTHCCVKPGVIVGIVLIAGEVIIIILVASVLGYFYWKKQKKNKPAESIEMNMSPEESKWLLERIANADGHEVTKVTSEWSPASIRWRPEKLPNADDCDVTEVTSPKPRECSPQLEMLPNTDDYRVTKVTSPKPRECLHTGERRRPRLEKLANTDDCEVTKVTSPKPQERSPQLEDLANADDSEVTKVTSPKPGECSPLLDKLPNTDDSEVTKVTSPKPGECSPPLEKLPNADDSEVTKVTSPKPGECSPPLEKLPNADDSEVTKVTSPKPGECSPQLEKLPNADDSEVTKVTSPKPGECSPQLEKLPNADDSEVTKVTSAKPGQCSPQLEKLPNADDSEVTKVTSPKPQECSPQLEDLPDADDSEVTKLTSPKPQEWSPQLEDLANADDSEVTKVTSPKTQECSPQLEDLANADHSEVTNVTSPKLREWSPVSKRWRSQLEKLANADDCNVTKVGSLVFVEDYEFRIAKGSDGNEVFLGLKEDGTEVAVKRMTKSNCHVLKKEKNFLGLPELDDPSIVRYVDFLEDKNFVYLVLQLCEYTLEEYITTHTLSELNRKQLANQVLKGLSILHGHKPTIVHRDIKPQNVLIDIRGKARLADFGISRLLPEGQTTLFTSAAGTKCWRAMETLDAGSDNRYKKGSDIRYKRGSDIQVAGMLIYYILSDGHHPFGSSARCEGNILDGKYNLHHVQDVVAKDLIERMINEDRNKRPKAEECLVHPFFWPNKRRAEYLRRIGNLKEIENCLNADEDLIRRLDQYAEQGQFNTWKHKFQQELVQKMADKKKSYPDNSFGLLRFIHDLHEHYADDEAGIDPLEMFPDLFGGVYMFAKEQDWNSRPSLKDMFTTEVAVKSPNPETKPSLSLPVQESGHSGPY